MDLDAVVVGGGVIGLAIARAIAKSGRETVVVERERAIGTATSSRNSGVVHAGVYYPAGSLKARLCVRGKALLYDYCASRGVPHRRCGKLIVATTDVEINALRDLERSGAANGVADLEWRTAQEVGEIEPAVECTAALHSPSSGIVDAPALMQALYADIEANGGHVVLNTVLDHAERADSGFRLTLSGQSPARVSCRALINAAGLEASAVASRIDGLAPRHIPRTGYARGHYFALAGPPPFSGLVYPVPTGGGLGIHATVDLAGRIRFGPDVEWIDRIDYRFDASRVTDFAAAIRRDYPKLDPSQLTADYTGIRPKIYGPSDPPADFRIDTAEHHGVRGLVNLFGIESPGLTAALAVGEFVAG